MNGCGIERVDFDWNSVNIQVPDLQPVVHDLLFSSIFESLQIASLFADSYEIRVTGPFFIDYAFDLIVFVRVEAAR